MAGVDRDHGLGHGPQDHAQLLSILLQPVDPGLDLGVAALKVRMMAGSPRCGSVSARSPPGARCSSPRATSALWSQRQAARPERTQRRKRSMAAAEPAHHVFRSPRRGSAASSRHSIRGGNRAVNGMCPGRGCG